MIDSFVPKSRNSGIDTARGFACAMPVSYHAIGSTPELGLHVDAASYWRVFADLLIYIRMPIFGFVAGYVYALKPFSGNALGYIAAKARRLLLPMLVVGTLFAIVQALVPGTNGAIERWSTLHILPVAHYWFLEALFLIFVIVMILESARLLDRAWAFAFVLAAALALEITVDASDYFALNGVIYLLPYFLCGLAICRYSVKTKLVVPIAVAVLATTLAYVTAASVGYSGASVPQRNSLIGTMLGLSASFLVFQMNASYAGLSFIGKNSYVIFLFHPFFTASTRMFMQVLHFKSFGALVLVLTMAGLTAPIIWVGSSNCSRWRGLLCLETSGREQAIVVAFQARDSARPGGHRFQPSRAGDARARDTRRVKPIDEKTGQLAGFFQMPRSCIRATCRSMTSRL
ncbi:MAG: acyltransferase family protein [Rhodoplanes sp.]